ncbi:MAG TPA: polyamine aminopropyltransferase [Accumulibacter sp.]|nr:polyamine aminopropyltransferase [Accumulibacter sp.]HMW18151.1 polyamine aminopropyltransferase [Accumulibacter sp.]HMY07280.1 polyamine aminopropyltransferase [Accumulibacter sp.]HNC18365.1 polyamine aminopropyltransferase [Accumulibacter sp.]HND80611.1 polyamine aminopropyltransferase [Accumulibacter sp.]
MNHALLFSVFIVASCGLAYELIAGALASYLLGDSILQFSTVIGAYLFAMGIGSWLSRYIEQQLVARFIQVELLVGLLGGLSAAGLFFVFAWSPAPFRVLLYLAVLTIGILVGLEIPLIMRILKRDLQFKDLVSQVLTFDYLGALAVSVLFPVLLVPHLGLMRSGLLFGVLNVAVALWAAWLFSEQLAAASRRLRAQGIGVLLLLLVTFAAAGRLTSLAEAQLYHDEIVHSESTPYQRIVVTRWKDDLRLHLNNNLQFSSRDEYRYHEALVHPGLATLPHARRVLILGGGDGLALREVLKYPQIEAVTLVDLDPAMTGLFSRAAALRKLNADSLSSPKVTVVNADALQWLEENDTSFDFVVVDFPDPSNFAIGKLYSASFYRLLEKHLNGGALAVIQSTSPLYARRSFWCVVNTIASVDLVATPYHALVPSFGEWGFVLASRHPYRPPTEYPVAMRFLTPETTPALFVFPGDMARVDTEINRLNNQVLVRYFENEWRQVIR